MKTTSQETGIENTPALYRAVWRWHFYAGIIVAPFVIFLAITGAIYLWRPQYESWRYRELFTVPAGAVTVSADAQLRAAQTAVPAGWRAQSYQPGFRPGETTQVTFKPGGKSGRGGATLIVFVNPSTGTVIGQLDDDTRFMRIAHDLHGTLLAGSLILGWTVDRLMPQPRKD